MTAVVPIDRPFKLTVSIHKADMPENSRAVTQLLARIIGKPIAAELAQAGFEVGDLENIVYGSLVTYAPAPGGQRSVLSATFPHPLGPEPECTLFSVDAVTCELVGGVHDGLRREPNSRERELYVEQGVPYARTGYHVVDGVWVYQYVSQPAKEGPRGAAAEA